MEAGYGYRLLCKMGKNANLRVSGETGEKNEDIRDGMLQNISGYCSNYL